MLTAARTVTSSLLVFIRPPGSSDPRRLITRTAACAPGLLPAHERGTETNSADLAFQEFTAKSAAVKYDVGENGVDMKFVQREEEKAENHRERTLP